jgi:hypothetical protein
LSQIVAALLLETALGQWAAGVGGGQAGKAVGRVVGDQTGPELFGGNHARCDPLLNGLDGATRNGIQLVPAVRRGERLGREVKAVRQTG